MKQYVIPHNIMDIDFKLFGFMNIKQFIYVAGGAVCAYITYILVREGVVPGILGWPFIIFVFCLGLSFGLVPFKGRSLDQWLISYITAINSPTKRAWMKQGITPKVIPSSIPINLLKPKTITFDVDFTVTDIIGGLSVPIPELSVEQKAMISNKQELNKETIKATPLQTPNLDGKTISKPQTVKPIEQLRYMGFQQNINQYENNRFKQMSSKE